MQLSCVSSPIERWGRFPSPHDEFGPSLCMGRVLMPTWPSPLVWVYVSTRKVCCHTSRLPLPVTFRAWIEGSCDGFYIFVVEAHFSCRLTNPVQVAWLVNRSTRVYVKHVVVSNNEEQMSNGWLPLDIYTSYAPHRGVGDPLWFNFPPAAEGLTSDTLDA